MGRCPIEDAGRPGTPVSRVSSSSCRNVPSSTTASAPSIADRNPSFHDARHGAYTNTPPVAGSVNRYATTQSSPGNPAAYRGRLALNGDATTVSPPSTVDGLPGTTSCQRTVV